LVLASRVPFLVGAPRMDPRSQDVYYNSAYLLSEDGRITVHYDKLHLVPFGEFIPFKRLLYFVEKFAPMPIGDFSKGKDYTVFSFPIRRDTRSENVTWKLWKRVRFSTLICFEDIFPDLTRRFVKEGIDFLVNMTNDAWFHKTSAAYQHAQCSVFRAVENRIAVIRAANTGLSCFIDQKGRIVSTVKEGGEELFVGGFKSHAITLARTRTLYCVYGDIFAYLCIAFSCAYIIVLFQFRKVN